jgi:hypothetical protein
LCPDIGIVKNCCDAPLTTDMKTKQKFLSTIQNGSKKLNTPITVLQCFCFSEVSHCSNLPCSGMDSVKNKSLSTN